MKNLLTFGEFIQINEKFASFDDSFRATLEDRLKGIKDDNEEMGEEMCNIKLITTQYQMIAKTLGLPMKSVALADSEENYEFVESLSIGLRKRVDSQDSNIELVKELNFNSPWHSAATKRPMYHYHINDADIDLISWTDGDDFAEFDMIAFSEKDKKKLVDWVNANMSSADMKY
jgi:hypothetical protein